MNTITTRTSQLLALVFLEGCPESTKKMDWKLSGTWKNPCEGGQNFLFKDLGFLGAGGHTNGCFNECAGDLGVLHSSSFSRASFSSISSNFALALEMVLTGVTGMNSSEISRPICGKEYINELCRGAYSQFISWNERNEIEPASKRAPYVERRYNEKKGNCECEMRCVQIGMMKTYNQESCQEVVAKDDKFKRIKSKQNGVRMSAKKAAFNWHPSAFFFFGFCFHVMWVWCYLSISLPLLCYSPGSAPAACILRHLLLTSFMAFFFLSIYLFILTVCFSQLLLFILFVILWFYFFSLFRKSEHWAGPPSL